MQNIFLKQQIQNMKTNIMLFEKACEMAALKDDSKLSKEEERAIRRIKASGEKYKKALEKIAE